MTHDDLSSQNAQEWFGRKPEQIPGQMDLLGDAELKPDKPTSTDVAGTGRRSKSGKRRAGVAASKPARPASTERPPAVPMSVAEVVKQRLEATYGPPEGSTEGNPQADA